ncbi:hypothetical protein AB0E27_31590 [Streptomyces sparsogenes]|uniref:hypothetical protein n=1 Tax=Streptomyces sparsogenes TaxID=67365 RepID=UPI0034034CE6
MPNRYTLGHGPDNVSGGWKGTYTSPDGLITLHYDAEAYDFHIDAKEGYRPSSMRRLLEGARSGFGLELLDEDEMDPEILEDGTIRIYLAPIAAPAHAQLRLVAA